MRSVLQLCGSPALAGILTELTLAKTAAVSKADYIFCDGECGLAGSSTGC